MIDFNKNMFMMNEHYMAALQSRAKISEKEAIIMDANAMGWNSFECSSMICIELVLNS